MTEVEVRVTLLCVSTDNGRPLTGCKTLMWTVVEVVDLVTAGSQPCINSPHKHPRNLAHDFGVKLSPCMSSHVSCPGWRNGWHVIPMFISGEDIATYIRY